MGYNNRFSLKTIGYIDTEVKSSDNCDCDFITEDLTKNFCDKCGEDLIQKTIQRDTSNVIKEFVNESENDEISYLLDEDGSSNEGGSGYDMNEEVRKFSEKYPNVKFILTTQWEVAENGPAKDLFFFINGEERKAEVEITYTNPFTGEKFDLNSK